MFFAFSTHAFLFSLFVIHVSIVFLSVRPSALFNFLLSCVRAPLFVPRRQGPGVSAPLQRDGAVRSVPRRARRRLGAALAPHGARPHHGPKNEQKPQKLHHGERESGDGGDGGDAVSPTIPCFRGCLLSTGVTIASLVVGCAVRSLSLYPSPKVRDFLSEGRHPDDLRVFCLQV